MGSANKLVPEVLWRAKGLLENTEKRVDLVQYYLGGDLPILLHPGYYDGYGSAHTIFREIL